jgi:hypothetical protein
VRAFSSLNIVFFKSGSLFVVRVSAKVWKEVNSGGAAFGFPVSSEFL